MKELLEFKPLPLLTSGRWQTIMGSFGRIVTLPPSQKIDILLPDGDVLVCKISMPPKDIKAKGVVLLIHGLGGSENSKYMLRISRTLISLGYVAVRLNLRGCGPGQGLAKKPHYAGGSADLFPVMERIHQEFKGLPLQIVGFSLGGHILLKFLGELGANAPPFLVNSIAVCAAIEPADTVKLFGLPRNKLFQDYYLMDLVKFVRINEKIFPDIKKTEFPDNLSLYLYDELYVAPNWGFKSADEYYDLCRASRFIPLIKSPCKILYTQDDPLVNYRIFDELKVPDSVQLKYTAHGGHMGFLGFTGEGWGIRWMDKTIINWLTG